MSTIHLWDNSWHVIPPNDGIKDSYGRRAKDLDYKNKKNSIEVLRVLSSSTIGKLMEDEEGELLIWPNSLFRENEDLKDQYIFRISEKNGNLIDSVTTNNIVGFIGRGNTDIQIHSRFSSIGVDGKGNDHFLYYMIEKVMGISLFSLTSSNRGDAQVLTFSYFYSLNY